MLLPAVADDAGAAVAEVAAAAAEVAAAAAVVEEAGADPEPLTVKSMQDSSVR